MASETSPGESAPTDPVVDAEVVPNAPRPIPSTEDGAIPKRWRLSSDPPAKTAYEELAADSPPVSWRELAAVLLMVVLADLTIYRTHGFAGIALFFAVAPAFLLLGSPKRLFSRGLLIAGLMLLVLAVRLVWCGSVVQVVCGVWLLVAFSMALAGIRPFVIELFVYVSQVFVSGLLGLETYRRTAHRLSPILRVRSWVNIGLPLVALLVFGWIFIVANPALLTWFKESLEWLTTLIRQWCFRSALSWWEVPFWVAVAWLTVALLRPVSGPMIARLSERFEQAKGEEKAAADAPLYIAFRNTLLAVVALFAVYLVFEFHTLWFRDFPEGFYYAGYAHQGAAWLTVALALATVVLSLVFRGAVLADPRQPRLRRLAWIWSAENLLLAAAVYNRLLIYVHFNGMTWMRTVAFFGITCVVVGFGLVVWKIAQNRSFAWLLRHHLMALALCIYLFALTPVDALVHDYNVRRIMAGDSAPSVQISVHPISTEGYPVLLALADCPDAKVREGVLAMLAERHDRARRRARMNANRGWTTYQGAERALLEQLDANQAKWAAYTNAQRRTTALNAFREYAYQWY